MISRDHKIYRVTLTGSIVNMILLVMKFVAGILGNSAAMIADAVHSLSDFLTDIVVIALVKLSSKPADKDHDYGHGKYETIATSIIGMALVKSGESKTISVAKPANCGLLYAACYDASGHAMCQPFQAKATGTEISFNGKSPVLSETFPTSSGNAWSVDFPNMPDLSAYTTGAMVEASEAEKMEARKNFFPLPSSLLHQKNRTFAAQELSSASCKVVGKCRWVRGQPQVP